MRAGVAVGRALVSSLHRISHTRKSPFSSLSPGLLSKSVGGVVRKEHYGIEFGTFASPSFALRGVIDGHPRAFSVGGIEAAAIGCFRPRTQNYVFLQSLATQTPTHTSKQTPAQTPTRTPLDSKASSETKAPSANTSSSPAKPSSLPPPPSTGTGKPEEKAKPKPKESGIVKQMLLDFGAVPFPALVLGLAGLIPFVSLAPPLAPLLPLPEILAVGYANAQAAYGASIISFLGAIHWGLAMADYAAPSKGGVANMTLMTSRYVWSVVPSLIAWTALLLPATSKFAVLIFSLWMVLFVDFLFARLKLVPYWFLSLRWPLTFVATVSMVPSMLAAATWS